jgi:UDP-N-acetyl-2-amino-2-deoxyglucuronate dehydrogenase
MSTPESLRLAFVGCGAIARWHLEAIGSYGKRTVVTAAVDVDEARAGAMASAAGARPFTSVADALAGDDFDAALVMVPPHAHEQVAVEVLAAHRHLLLEKPMAHTLDSARRILDAAAGSDAVFMVAENAQYWPEIVAVKELIDAGAIGDVITARAWHCSPPLEEFYGSDREREAVDDRPWRLSAAATGGGVAIDTGSHWLRPLRMWLGEVSEVVAVTAHPFPHMEGESLLRSLCRFDSGVVASFDVILTPGPAAPLPLFQVTGTEGELVVEALGRVRLYDGKEWKGTVVTEGGYMESYGAQIRAFEAAILDGVAPPADAAYALGELRATLAMYRSSASGRWEPA